MCSECRPKRKHRKKIKEEEEQGESDSESSGTESPKIGSPMDFNPTNGVSPGADGGLGAWPTIVREGVAA